MLSSSNMKLINSPGRPLKIGRQPSSVWEQKLSEQQRALDAHVTGNHLVQLSQTDAGIEVLWAALDAAAREAASIAFQKTLTPVYHRDFGRLCSRHLDAIRDVAKLRLLIEHLEPGASSPEATLRVLDALRVLVLDAALEVLPADATERFSAALARRWDAASAAALGQR